MQDGGDGVGVGAELGSLVKMEAPVPHEHLHRHRKRQVDHKREAQQVPANAEAAVRPDKEEALPAAPQPRGGTLGGAGERRVGS